MVEAINKPENETTEEERGRWEQPSNPLFKLPSHEVRTKYELGDIGVEDVKEYKTYWALRNGGLWDMSEDQVRYAYERKLVTPDQVADYKAYQRTGEKPVQPSGWELNQLHLLSLGLTIEKNNGELEAPEFFMDPTDIAVDFATGGINTVRRIGFKGGKAAIKKLLKEGAKDVAYGRIAALTMDGIDAAGGGIVLQMIGGFTSPAVANAFATAGRRTLIDIFRAMRTNNKKAADQIEEIIEAVPEDPLAKKLKSVLEELDSRGIFQESDVRPKGGKGMPDVDAPEKIVQAQKVFDDLLENDGAKKLLDEQLGSEHLAGYTDNLLERIRTNGMSGVEIMESINGAFEKFIKQAKNTTTDKIAEAKVQNHIKALSNNMGMKKVKTEKLLQFAHDAKLSMRDMNIKARLINEALLSYTKQLDEFLDTKIFNTTDPIFADVLEAMEHIRNIAQLQEAFYGIRGEFGRGLRIYRNDQMMKNRFDFENIPRMDYEALKAGKERDLLKALRHYRDANTPKAKNRRARNLMKNRFLKGVLEFEQASLLMHWKTQAINILGSGMAAANEMAVRYASINWRAWKEAGGWQKPFTRDAHTMLEWKIQKEAWKEALVDTLRVEGGWKGLIKSPRKAITSPEAGKAWKAFMTAEPQLDSLVKYEGQSMGALPDYLKIAGMKMPLGKVMRLPFHGLTAGDEVFKGIGYRMELNRLLYREAVRAGAASEDSIRKYMAAVLDKGIPSEMHEAAMKQARYQTFTEDLGSGALGKFEGVMNTKAGLLGRILFMPFIRVTINLPKFALQQTPLGYAARWQRDTLKAAMKAGATIEQKQAAMEIYARWALGMSVLTSGIALHQSGMITGRTPRDQRDIHQAAGVQPYSWVIDKEDGSKDFVDYNRIDPHAFLFGIGADLSGAWDMMQWYAKDQEQFGTSEIEMGEIIMAYLTAFTAPLMEKTIAKSAKEAINFAVDPENKNWEEQGRKQLAKFFPRALDMFHEMRGADTVMREARSVTELALKKLWPEAAPPMRHIIYGDIVQREDRVMGLLNRRTMRDDPVMEMLIRTGTNVKEPAQKGVTDGVPWEMTNEQYDEYLERISKSGLKEALQQMVAELKASGTKDDAFISDQLRSLISTYREAVRTEILYGPQGEGGVLTPEEISKRWELKADAALGKVALRHKTARNYNWLTED